jgi:hypothetical protein
MEIIEEQKHQSPITTQTKPLNALAEPFTRTGK